MAAIASAVRGSAETAVRSWLNHPDKGEACKRAIAFIETGAYDFSPSSLMYGELEGLVSWAKR